MSVSSFRTPKWAEHPISRCFSIPPQCLHRVYLPPPRSLQTSTNFHFSMDSLDLTDHRSCLKSFVAVAGRHLIGAEIERFFVIWPW